MRSIITALMILAIAAPANAGILYSGTGLPIMSKGGHVMQGKADDIRRDGGADHSGSARGAGSSGPGGGEGDGGEGPGADRGKQNSSERNGRGGNNGRGGKSRDGSKDRGNKGGKNK